MKVIVLRGISGSGKTTWLKENHPDAVVASADDFFLSKDGSYNFDESKQHEAHKACYQTFIQAILNKEELIAVDNGNITVWEMAPYVMPAESFGYGVEVVTLLCDPETAIARKDWVPADKVRSTAKRLDEQTKEMPDFTEKIHHVIENG